ncbi:MAG TPA: OmpA family protein [Sandaracinaceae bacterium LLY-WYZ-13_1]|nr:OmpA family protein [Sandaracinaceae bacterium LLY-WYZ-13_1]
MKRLATIALLSLTVGCGGATVVEDDGELRVELRGNRIVINQKIEFAHDSAEILESSYPILDQVVAILEEHEEIYRVQVQGHTSTVGEDQHNMELSAARAEAIGTYLREHGVTQEVTSQGYGETYPLCQEDTDACHARNRRVEFFVDSR